MLLAAKMLFFFKWNSYKFIYKIQTRQKSVQKATRLSMGLNIKAIITQDLLFDLYGYSGCSYFGGYIAVKKRKKIGNLYLIY